MKFCKKISAVLLACVFVLAGCAGKETGKGISASADLFAMDTYMTLTAYGEKAEEAIEAAKEEILRIDALLSAGSRDSAVSLVNAAGSGILDDETLYIVKEALEIYEMTGGAFDITIYPLAHLWGFTDGDMHLPSDEEIKEALENVGAGKLELDGSVITLAQGQGIDLGGIAKGYTSDRVMEIFKEYELDGGVVSLGGNVQCFGQKPDGTLWKVGVQKPGEEGLVGVLQTEGKAVITSGGYERYFEGEDGTVYHHILDPATGYPANSGIVSCTIVSDEGILADGLSTACFIMGTEKACGFWREHADEFDMIILDEEGELYITENIAGTFSTDYPVNIISS